MKKIANLISLILLFFVTSFLLLTFTKDASALTVVSGSLWETDGSGYYGLSETNSKDGSRTNRIALMSNPYVTSSSYTMSAHLWSGSTTAGETISSGEVQLGIVPYYIDDDNFLAVYMEWKNSVNSTKMAAVTMHLRSNGTDTWTSSWVHDHSARTAIAKASNYSTGYDLKVDVTATTVKVTCSSVVLEYEQSAGNWVTSYDVSSKFSALCGSGVTAKAGLIAYNCQANAHSVSFSSGSSSSTTTGSNWTVAGTGTSATYSNSGSTNAGNNAFYLLSNSVATNSTNYKMKATFKSSSSTAGETVSGGEVKMGLVPYYVDEDNFINVYMEWKNSISSTKMCGITMQIMKGGTDTFTTSWVYDHSARTAIATASNAQNYIMVVDVSSTTIKVTVNDIVLEFEQSSGVWVTEYDVSAYFSNMTGTSANTQSGLYTYNCDATVSSVSIISEKYTVSFNSNGGSGSMSTQSIPCGITKTLNANTFTRTGYVFDSWNTVADGSGTGYADQSEVVNLGENGDTINLYAQWTPIGYKVIFNANGGLGTMDAQSFKYDTAQNLTANAFTKKGYTFMGWSTSSTATTATYTDKGSAKNLATTNGAEVTLYAVWKQTSYKVAYDANGGSGTAPATETIMSTVEYTIKDNPFTRTGYVFKGWSLQKDVQVDYQPGDVKTDLTTTDGATVTLYAYWMPITYTVEFHSNNGSDETAIQDISYGETVSLDANAFTKKGYSFAGWATSESGTKVYEDGSSVSNLSSDSGAVIKLYALWVPNTYEIVFNANGGEGTMDNQVITYDTTENLTGIAFTKTGYKFIGWSITNGSNEVKYIDKASVTNLKTSGTYNLYAVWEVLEFSISYETNGGTTINATTGTYGSAITLPQSPLKEGYTFEGWYTDEACSNAFTAETIPAENLTIYANWTPNKYEIIFVSNGGTNVETLVADYGSSISAPTAPTKEGYTFVGWYAEEALENEYEFTTMPLNGTTVYAKWDANEYVITFVSNGGSEVEAITAEYGSSISIPTAPTKEGYSFAGWYAEEELTNIFKFTTMPLNGATVYAKWSANLYTITLELNGGTGQTEVQGAFGDVVANVEDPERLGHTFVGWYSDSEGLSEYEFTTIPSQDIIVYAKWSANTYSISFETNGGNTIETISGEYGSEILFPEDPIKEGYTFEFWCYDKALETVYVGTTYDAKDITLYAKWTANKYEMVFVTNGGSILENVTADFEAEVVAPINPTKEGYVFTGWYTDSELTNAYEFTTMPLDGITLYAKWTPISYVIRFYKNGANSGTMADLTATYDKEITLSSNEFVWIGHTFKGWSRSETGEVVYEDGAVITENLTSTSSEVIKLYAVWEIITYKVIFNNYDGTELETVTVNYGEAATYSGEEPAKASEGFIRYEFIGWDKAFSNVTSDLVITAQFDEIDETPLYTVIFKNYDNSLLQEVTVKYGETAVYSYTEPLKPAEGYIRYEFAGWDISLENITSDMVATAQFDEIDETPEYEVVFENYDGTELETVIVRHGNAASYSGETPTKVGEGFVRYEFIGWDKAVTNIVSDLVVTAQFKAIDETPSYTVTFKNYDGTELHSKSVKHGGSVVYTLSTPTKAPSGFIRYEFIGWDKSLENITNDLVVTAQFEEIDETPEYIVVFKNYDGEVLEEVTVMHGESASFSAETPVRDAEGHIRYEFIGWDKSLENITSNLELIAQFEAIDETPSYTVTFKNYNGEKLFETTVKEGSSAQYEGDEPTKETNESFVRYEFIGWDKSLDNVTSNLEIIAQFEAIDETPEYEVVFKNYDGTVLETAVVRHGEDASYSMSTPTKETNEEFIRYEFIGWDKEFTNVTSNLVITAQFEAIDETPKYEVVFKNYDGTILQEVVVRHGEGAIYTQAEPLKPTDAFVRYEFIGWDKEFTNVTSNLVITAQFEAIDETPSYTVEFENYDGILLKTYTVKHGETVVFDGELPTKEGEGFIRYEFIGWDKPLENITSNLIVKAQYKEIDETPEYTVIFKNYDDTVLATTTVKYGEEAIYNGPVPTRPETEYIRYEFKGWNKDTTYVTSNLEVIAQYNELDVPKTFTVTFKNYDGTVLATAIVQEGETVVYPNVENPTREAEGAVSFEFAGWDKSLENITSDLIITAQFNEIDNSPEFTVTFKNYDDTVLATVTVKSGKSAIYTGETPTKPANEHIAYVFNGWDKSLENITENIEVIAQYVEYDTRESFTVTFKNYDGTILSTVIVKSGETAVYPNAENPTRQTENSTEYTFKGWDKPLENITENIEVIAQYDEKEVIETPEPTPTDPETPEVELVKLGTVVIEMSETGLVTWEAVENAVGYRYKIDGGTEITTTELSVQLKDGQSIVVQAVGDNATYSNGDYSNVLTFEVEEEIEEVEIKPETNTGHTIGYIISAVTGMGSLGAIAFFVIRRRRII